MRPVAEGGFGYTDGCRGCEAARDGRPPVNHSEACRRRIETATAQTDAVAERLAAAKRTRTADDAQAQTAGEAEASRSSGTQPEPADAPMLEAGPTREFLSQGVVRDRNSGGGAAASGPGPESDPTEAAGSTQMEVSGLVKNINESIIKLGGRPISISGLDSQGVVSELFGRGNFLDRATRFGLAPGTAFDLANGWDLNDEVQRKEADTIIDNEAPILLIGSPRCTAWSNLMNFGTASLETKAALMK